MIEATRNVESLERLFEPHRLGGVLMLANRIVMAPMTRTMAASCTEVSPFTMLSTSAVRRFAVHLWTVSEISPAI